MADVYHAGVKMHSYDAASVGLDNFRLHDLSVSAEEETWGGVKGLYR